MPAHAPVQRPARIESETSPLLPPPHAPPAPPVPPQLSLAHILGLTCIHGGVQVFFSTVMADLAPYLHTLGVSKSATAVICICLPLAGALVGPLAGAYSDRRRGRYGRRRPVILLGAAATLASLLLLAWIPRLVPADRAAARVAAAVLCTVAVAVAIQPVQTGARCLAVDVAPPAEQRRVWGWAGRVQGVAAIFSFFASSVTLSRLPGLGGLTQFQALALLNLVTLGSTVAVTVAVIREKDSTRVALSASGEAHGEGNGGGGVLQDLKRVGETLRGGLPRRVRQTCVAQFSSWMAWFPLLYYTTTLIGELDVAMQADEDGGRDELAQAGSLGSLSFATVGFIVVTALPTVLPSISRRISKRTDDDQAEDQPSNLRHLVWLWTLAQPLLGILEVLTLAAAYKWQGIVLVAAAGIPWAVTQWVPHAIVGYEISRLGLTGADEADAGENSTAGAILGVHNMAISLPQVIAGLVAGSVYKIAEHGGSQVPTSWVLAVSGIAAFVAASQAKRIL